MAIAKYERANGPESVVAAVMTVGGEEVEAVAWWTTDSNGDSHVVVEPPRRGWLLVSDTQDGSEAPALTIHNVTGCGHSNGRNQLRLGTNAELTRPGATHCLSCRRSV